MKLDLNTGNGLSKTISLKFINFNTLYFLLITSNLNLHN